MKVCIPAATDAGLSSSPFGHFGSAPFFVIHDTESSMTQVLANANDHHAGGGCQPLAALRGQSVDAFVVGGIGSGAIQKLNASGVCVYQGKAGTVEDNVKALKEGALTELTVAAGCQSHGGCDH